MTYLNEIPDHSKSELKKREAKKHKESEGPNARFRFYEFCYNNSTLWRGPDGKPYADVMLKGKPRTMSFSDGSALDSWLHLMYEQLMNNRGIPTSEILGSVKAHLEAKARTSDNIFRPFLRIHRNGDILYYDLNNEAGEMVKCTGAGWEILPKGEVKFVAGEGMLPQTRPLKGGDMGLLRKYFHVSSENDYRLIISWLFGAFVGSDSFPVLILNGGAGSAKSTATLILQSLIDPNALTRRDPPKDSKDAAAIVFNAHVYTIDNVSVIPQWFSDFLCRLSTGGAIGGREYYTLRQDAGFEAIRPVIVNGIPSFVEAGDLMERCVLIKLPTAPKDNKLSTGDFLKMLEEEDKALILGAIFDTICKGLALYKLTKVDKLPRLATWGRFMEAIASSLGWDHTFMNIWESQETEKAAEIVGGNGLAMAILDTLSELREKHGEPMLSGTAREILGKIQLLSNTSENMPKNARSFATSLKRIEKDLRSFGIEILDAGRSSKGHRMEIRLKNSKASLGV